MTVEEIISSMPYSIEREETYHCNCCGTEKPVSVRYTLELKVFRSYDVDGKGRDHYHAYYMACCRENGYEIRYIGDKDGIGYATLTEALLALKEEIERVK